MIYLPAIYDEARTGIFRLLHGSPGSGLVATLLIRRFSVSPDTFPPRIHASFTMLYAPCACPVS